MSLFDIVAKLTGGLLQESMMDQIRVEALEDNHTLVMKDGSLASMLHLGGALRNPGEEEIVNLVERLRIVLSAYFSSPGHSIEINFMRDAEAAKRHLSRMVKRTKRAAHSLGLDLDDVLSERATYLPSKMVSETCLITIFTRPSVLSKDEAKEDSKAVTKRIANLPPITGGQVQGKVMDSMISRHHSLVEAMHGVLTSTASAQICNVLSARETLQEMRAGIYPDTYPIKDEWNPVLPGWYTADKDDPAINPGNRCLTMAPETPEQLRAFDFGNLTTPTFDRQLATEDSFIENTRTVRVGNMIFSGFDMTLAPETLPEFNTLVADITAKDKRVPWRASMRIDSGGVQAQSLKMMFLSIFVWASPTRNRRLRAAIQANQEAHGQTDTVVRFRMSFSTWAAAGKVAELRRNAQIVTGAVKRWGNSGVDGISGDPMATIMSSMPGVTTFSTAPVASGPLSDVLAMTPLSRQASPWDSGAVIFRTRSGKPWMYQPGSSLQNTWVTGIVGTPGAGKSVLMNEINFATAITPSASSGTDAVLPRIAIIDIGPSSSGLISLLQEALPANRRHEVLFKKLKNDSNFAINIFDTQPGMRRPMATERTFLINFISLVMSDGSKPLANHMRGLIEASIDMVYHLFSDSQQPKRYVPDEQPVVDRALDDLGFNFEDETIWWEVVDFLFEKGRLHESEIAQRQAVPTISDLVTASLTEQIADIYGDATDSETGQPVMKSFQRNISEITRGYPILAGHTRYSIGSARVVSFDLKDVTARGSGPAAEKQTAMMYMLARQIMTRDFFIDKDEIPNAIAKNYLPEEYRDFHITRARELESIPKLFCMDEFHRCGALPAITSQILMDAREGRKFNVDIKIASQLIEDFPKPIIEVLSSLVVCNASENSITVLDEMFRLTDNEKQIIRHNLNGPTSEGAPIWALFKTKNYGQVRQELILTLGPAEIWAFSTTSEDVAIRQALYEELGPKEARRVLADRWPQGSAKADIEARIARREEQGERFDEEGRNDVIAELLESLKRQAFITASNKD